MKNGKLLAVIRWFCKPFVMLRYYFEINKLRKKQDKCQHEKGDWLDDHCGVSYYECKKCKKLLIYW